MDQLGFWWESARFQPTRLLMMDTHTHMVSRVFYCLCVCDHKTVLQWKS